MKENVILHSDLNCYYASVEMNERPELYGTKMAVCGSTENRHGIVLTASYPAKRMGVRTGMANWQAKQVCPELIMVEPRYELYLHYSRIVRSIYRRFANHIEPFGMDESWIGLPCCTDPEEDGKKLAEEIRRTVRKETGLTVSVGVSFSKVMAKLGSDMKKPDAVTVISRKNYREKVWPLPVRELLYVGPATEQRLARCGIYTIGELACADPALLRYKLGKNGIMLHDFANGTDGAPVMPDGTEQLIKSVGHGTTCVQDLKTETQVWKVIYELAQEVGSRLRKCGLTAKAVELTVRDRDLEWKQWQAQMPCPTRSPFEIAQSGYRIFCQNYAWEKPVRALTIRGISLMREEDPVQTNVFGDWRSQMKRRIADDCIDDLRKRFGYRAICPAELMGDLLMAQDRCETVPMPAPMYR